MFLRNNYLSSCAALLFCGVVLWTLASRAAELTPDEHFKRNVRPIFENTCINCHGQEKHKGDLRLDSREAALKGGKEGPALVPGKPSESLMIKLVHRTDPDREMPPKEKLPDTDIAALERWIADGAPWPAVGVNDSVSLEGVGDAWSDPRNPIVQIFGGKRLDLWSLKPIADPTPPKVSDEKWVRNPIDAFVLAKLEASHARPAPETDRRTLARRLYFDLTGLPPTPEEVTAFLSDESPDAYQKLVDHLLASPRYGEHWGRMWLDVARYSDSDGFDWDEFRPEAWRYRDYVIRAFNADKPFDVFVREQLAGDEMVPGPPVTTEDQQRFIATGFLRVGPYDNSASKFGESNRCRAQVMSDLVETTGSAFLGITFICARCHNHKFDPISQADYYRMRAFFEGVQPADHIPLNLVQEQKSIHDYNVELQKQIESCEKTCSDIARPVVEKLRANRIKKLSLEDRALIEGPPPPSNSPDAHKLEHLMKKITPTEEQYVHYLGDAEREICERENAAADRLKEQVRTYMNGLVVLENENAPPPTHLLSQGDFNQPRSEVLPGFLSVFDPAPAKVAKPTRVYSSGRRTVLAEWIVSKKNPLTARVLVNRVWDGHFGEPIVPTSADFGFAGAKPTHPELLDWLARQFVREGWSLKKLHRLIVTSSTYKQSMTATGGRRPRRLSAEQLRDAALAVCGRLLPCEGGPPLWPALPEEVLRSTPSLVDDEFVLKRWQKSPPEKTMVRSVYLVQKRNVRVPLMETFDLPDNTLSCPRRSISTVAPQALTLLNDTFYAEIAGSFAQRVAHEVGADPGAQIERAFTLALQRAPDAEERTKCADFVKARSLAEFCRTLLNLNEFIYID